MKGSVTPSRPAAWSPLAVLLLISVWLACSAWFRPFTSPDEGRYAGVAHAMLQSGDWVVPRLNGLPFFHKPPLFYWIGAASMAIFGPHEWAARLPSLFGALLAAGSLHLFLRRHASLELSRLSALILCTSPFFYLGAQFANLDMLVAGCISMTVLAAADVVASDWRPEVARASDNWRKELADAAAFDSAAAQRLLQPIDAQPDLICAGKRTWVIGRSNGQLAAPWVLRMHLVTFIPQMAVWRYDSKPGARGDCLSGHSAPGALPPIGAAG